MGLGEDSYVGGLIFRKNSFNFHLFIQVVMSKPYPIYNLKRTMRVFLPVLSNFFTHEIGSRMGVSYPQTYLPCASSIYFSLSIGWCMPPSLSCPPPIGYVFWFLNTPSPVLSGVCTSKFIGLRTEDFYPQSYFADTSLVIVKDIGDNMGAWVATYILWFE